MIDGLPVLGIGQSGLLLIIVLMVITDRLVWHKRLDKVQERVETQAKLIEDLTEQNGMMLRSAILTVNAVLSALHQAAGDEP